MDIQKEREAFESWLFDGYERAINFDIVFCEHEQAYNHVPTQARWETWQAAKAQSVSDGFVLVPKLLSDEQYNQLEEVMQDNFGTTVSQSRDCIIRIHNELLSIIQEPK